MRFQIAGFKPFTILKDKQYRSYFIGQLISMSGAWIQQVAESWIAYRLTHSGFWLGLVSFAAQMPAFLASPWAGVLADRFDRRKILMWVRVLMTIQSLILGVLVLTNAIQLWHLIALAIALGVLNAFDLTTRQTFVLDIVGREHVSKAVAVNSATLNLSRIIGPAIAGFAISAVGEAWCFILNGLSNVPVFFALLGLRSTQRMDSAEDAILRAEYKFRHELFAAIRYVWRDRLTFRLLGLSTIVCFVAAPYAVLLPVFAKNILHGGAHTLGWLMGAMGFGAVAGIFTLGGSNRYIVPSLVMWGAGQIVLGFSTNFYLSFFSIFVIGHAMMGFFPAINSTLQTRTPSEFRGRIMSLYTMTFLGTMPVGSLVIGFVADRITAPHSVIVAGLLTLLITAWVSAYSKRGFSLA